MDFLSIILPPLVGGLIGYITNDLAIKMLFRPYRAVFVGKFQLPFTPGIVPKRLDKIAQMLGREVEAQFFNADDLEILFKSDAFAGTVADSLVDMLLSKQSSLCLAMEKLEASPDSGPIVRQLKSQLSCYAAQALQNFDFEPLIYKASESLSTDKKSSLRNTVNTFAPSISEAIQAYFKENGNAALEPLIEELLVSFGDRPVNKIVEGLISERDTLQSIIKAAYMRFMNSYVRKVVESIDVGGMITEKLKLMDPQAVEMLILSVVKKEFKYIVWLGGLLGMIIGTVNIFL